MVDPAARNNKAIVEAFTWNRLAAGRFLLELSVKEYPEINPTGSPIAYAAARNWLYTVNLLLQDKRVDPSWGYEH